MAAYDLEEQERLAALKDWWDKWGTLIIAALVAFIVGILGTQGWRYYQKQQAGQAAASFADVTKLAQETTATKDWKKLSSAATAIAEKYPSTFYASDAQLMAAKAAFDNGGLAEARTHLEWVVSKGRDAHRNIARVRLAAVMLDQKAYDDALKTLDVLKDEAFISIAADLKGDVFAAQGKRDEARAAYDLAVQKAEERSPLKAISQAKLDAFGGALEKPVEAKKDAKDTPDSKDAGAKK